MLLWEPQNKQDGLLNELHEKQVKKIKKEDLTNAWRENV